MLHSHVAHALLRCKVRMTPPRRGLILVETQTENKRQRERERAREKERERDRERVGVFIAKWRGLNPQSGRTCTSEVYVAHAQQELHVYE